MKDADYRKLNDRSFNSSTYHKKDGTEIRAILKEESRKEIEEELLTIKKVHCDNCNSVVEHLQITKCCTGRHCDCRGEGIILSPQFCDNCKKTLNNQEVKNG